MAEHTPKRDNTRDSAPGVNDGRAGADRKVGAKPGGRGMAFMIVAAVLVIMALVFIARPKDATSEGEMVTMGSPKGEIENSTVPGAAPPTPATATPAQAPG